jgi:hypothetical protein
VGGETEHQAFLGAVGPVAHAERGEHGRHDLLGGTQRSEGDPEDPVRKAPDERADRLEGQSRLAGSSHAREREEARGGNARAELRQLVLASEEASGRGREPGRASLVVAPLEVDAQRPGHFRGVRRPLRDVRLEGPAHDRDDRPRHLGEGIVHRRVRRSVGPPLRALPPLPLLAVESEEFLERHRLERMATGEKAVQEDAERVEVGRGPGLGAVQEHFGSRGVRSRGGRLDRGGIGGPSTRPEVHEHGASTLLEDDVGFLDVAVHDPGGMDGDQGFGHGQTQAGRLARGKGPGAPESLREGLPGEALGPDADPAVPHVRAIDHGDVGMTDARHAAGLLEEPTHLAGVLEARFGRIDRGLPEFEGDLAFEHGIEGEMDGPERTLAEDPEDLEGTPTRRSGAGTRTRAAPLPGVRVVREVRIVGRGGAVSRHAFARGPRAPHRFRRRRLGSGPGHGPGRGGPGRGPGVGPGGSVQVTLEGTRHPGKPPEILQVSFESGRIEAELRPVDLGVARDRRGQLLDDVVLGVFHADSRRPRAGGGWRGSETLRRPTRTGGDVPRARAFDSLNTREAGNRTPEPRNSDCRPVGRGRRIDLAETASARASRVGAGRQVSGSPAARGPIVRTHPGRLLPRSVTMNPLPWPLAVARFLPARPSLLDPEPEPTPGLRPSPRRPATAGARFLTAAVCILAATGCQSERTPVEPGDAPDGGAFELGPPVSYPIDLEPGGALPDTLSTGTFVFPDGGAGTLTVARIVGTTHPGPMDSEGFAVEYSGDEKLELHLPRGPESIPLLWVYGSPDTSPYDGRGEAETWWPMMPEDDEGAIAIFPLVAPGDPEFAGLRRVPDDPTSGLPLDDPGRPAAGIHNYRFMRRYIRPNQPEWQTLHNLTLVTQWTIADVLAALPEDLRTFATTETGGRLALRSYVALPAPEVSAYSPFLFYSTYVGPPVRRLYPMLSYVCSGPNIATEATVAHEVGHYMNHVFFGDDAFQEFRRQQVVLDHDIGRVHPNRHMLEEYAQFVDYFKNGNVRGGLDIEEPIELFVTDPALLDYPAQEGYPTSLLARLHSTKPTIVGLSGDPEAIPVVGLPFTDLFRILYADTPTNLNQLRAAIALDLDRRGLADRLPALLERTGWSYHGHGRIVDEHGEMLEDAEIQAVSRVTGTTPGEYLAPLEPVRSDILGKFTLPRLFPGTNTLRVRHSGKVHEFTVTVDPNRSTVDAIDLGTFTVRDDLMDDLHHMTWARFTCDGEFLLDNGGMEVRMFAPGYDHLHPASWTGQELVWAFADSSAFGGAVSGTSIRLVANFSADGRTATSVVCQMRDWQTFDGRLQNERLSSIDLVDLPLHYLETDPGWRRADYELFGAAIDAHVRSISLVQRYLDVHDIVITATEFHWNGSTMGGHIQLSLSEY